MPTRSAAPDRGPSPHPPPPSVPAQPRIDPRYRVEIIAPDTVLLLSERGPRWLDGEIYARLAAVLDGVRSPAELVEALRDRVTPAEVFAALVLLGRAGLLSPGGPRSAAVENRPPSSQAPSRGATVGAPENRPPSSQAPSPQDDGADPAGNRPPSFQAPAVERRVSVMAGDGELRCAAVAAVDRWGWSVVEDGADLALVLVDDPLAPEVRIWAEGLRAAGAPWLLIRPRGELPRIGPFFPAAGGPCWECLAVRLLPNRSVEEHLVRALEARSPGSAAKSPLVPLPATAESIGVVLDEALRRWSGNAEAALEGRLLRLDRLSGEVTAHRVDAVPGCPVCDPPGGGAGEPEAAALAPEPLILRSQAKRGEFDGGYRAVAAAETLAVLERAISPLTGVIRAVERRAVVGGDLVHVFSAAYASPGRCDDWVRLRRRLRARSAGKGRSETQARVSALAEAVERYCGVFRGDEPRRRAAFEDLGDDAVHPNACMLFSPSQYRDRERWNEEEGHSNWVPKAFDPRRPVEWSAAWSLGEERFKLLPTALGFYDYRDTAIGGRSGAQSSSRVAREPTCLADSNGCAAGNTVEEAVLQGFLELVERDAAALWWYSRARRPRVPLETFEDPYFDRLPAVFASLGRDLWVLDLTTDFGLPVVVAVSRTVERRSDDLLMGFGAHLDPGIAVARALTEICQFLPLDTSAEGRAGAPDAGGSAVVSPRWLGLATGGEPQWLEPDAERPPRLPGSWSKMGGDDLAEDVRAVVALARARGLDVLVLDQSRREAPLPVVKVVVPGLRPWWARFAPGRLYDVPMDLGWIEQPLDEERLNPSHLFL